MLRYCFEGNSYDHTLSDVVITPGDGGAYGYEGMISRRELLSTLITPKPRFVETLLHKSPKRVFKSSAFSFSARALRASSAPFRSVGFLQISCFLQLNVRYFNSLGPKHFDNVGTYEGKINRKAISTISHQYGYSF